MCTMLMLVPAKSEEGVRFHESSGGKPPDVDAGNWNWVLCKNSICSQLLSLLSSPALRSLCCGLMIHMLGSLMTDW